MCTEQSYTQTGVGKQQHWHWAAEQQQQEEDGEEDDLDGIAGYAKKKGKG